MCENYLFLSHKTDIIKILACPKEEEYFSVKINFLELFEANTPLANALLSDPNESLTNWKKALFKVQTELLKELDNNFTLKNHVNCRIWNLPPWPHVTRTTFPGNDDAGQFLQITGTVVRMSARKVLEYQRQYICVKCKYLVTVEAQYDKNYIIKQPKTCPNSEGCNGKNIIAFGELDTYNCKDYQEISIQEDLSKVGVGTLPNHMVVTLEDDLVNICKPGENVTITGIVTRRWSEFDKGAKIIVDIVLKANYVQVNNSSGLSLEVSEDMVHCFDNFWQIHKEDPLAGRNIILQSISPELYGLHLVKLAIAIVLAGGCQSDAHFALTGIDTRFESHLLLVGDPGTGKSHLLRFASKIIPRSILTTGVGSTAAGLTVTAVIENGEWQLEAGALVMANGGICCVDEFNSMREHDRISIHEAMEQQTISVAKAGMVCKLKTRCSILAACNPKGNIDPLKPLCVNVAMSSPLLSRFDLILLLRDVVNEENDLKLADHLLNGTSTLSGDETTWSLDKLQAYYSVIKKHNPKLTSDTESILTAYYQLQRKFGNGNKARTTVRLLESLIRLSQGHAKLMYHAEVEVMDAIFAIILIDTAMDVESSILNLKINDTSLFDNPDQHYWEFLETILGKLNLDHIYQKEIEQAGVDKILQRNDESNSDLTQASISQHPPSLFTQTRLRHQSNKKDKTLSQAENLTLSQFVSEIVLNKAAEKTNNITKDSGNFSDFTSINESLNEPSTAKEMKCSKNSGLSSKINKSSTEKDTDLDFDKLFNNMQSSLNENARVEKSTWKALSGNSSNTKFYSNEEANVRASEINDEYEQLNLPTKSCKKRKRTNKKKIEKDTDLFKLMPSVNDDFAKFSSYIDWDMGEEKSFNCGIEENTNIDTEASDSYSVKEKVKILKETNLKENQQNVADKQPAKFPLLKNFAIQPCSEEKFDKPNNKESTTATSTTTIENTKSKFTFKKTLIDVDFLKLEEQMDSFEQNYCNKEKHFRWNSSDANLKENEQILVDKQSTKFPLLKNFAFQPRSEHEKIKKSNNKESTTATSNTTIKNTKSKITFIETLSDVDFSKLEEEMDKFEQNYCSQERHFRWNSSEDSRSNDNVTSESLDSKIQKLKKIK